MQPSDLGQRIMQEKSLQNEQSATGIAPDNADKAGKSSTLPRFSLNVCVEEGRCEKQHVELLDNRAAQVEALRLAGRILLAKAEQIELGQGFMIEVADEAQHALFRIDLMIADLTGLRIDRSEDRESILS